MSKELMIEVKIEKSDNDQFVFFKKWVKEHINFGPVTVVFTKKDGSERTMKCTTNANMVPKLEESTDTKREKKPNEDVMSVYDLEAAGWRSFRWDSVKQIKLEI